MCLSWLVFVSYDMTFGALWNPISFWMALSAVNAVKWRCRRLNMFACWQFTVDATGRKLSSWHYICGLTRMVMNRIQLLDIQSSFEISVISKFTVSVVGFYHFKSALNIVGKKFIIWRNWTQGTEIHKFIFKVAPQDMICSYLRPSAWQVPQWPQLLSVLRS